MTRSSLISQTTRLAGRRPSQTNAAKTQPGTYPLDTTQGTAEQLSHAVRMSNNHPATIIPDVRRSGIDRRTSPVAEPVLIRLPEVMAICALSRSGIYERVKNGTFPAPVKLDGRPSAWVRHEVQQWNIRQITASRRSETNPSHAGSQ